MKLHKNGNLRDFMIKNPKLITLEFSINVNYRYTWSLPSGEVGGE